MSVGVFIFEIDRKTIELSHLDISPPPIETPVAEMAFCSIFKAIRVVLGCGALLSLLIFQ